MATKQAKSNADTIKERARAILPAFGASGDPWRDGPALKGLSQALSPDASRPYGDHSQAYTDRYGTAGIRGDAEYNKPDRADASQRPEAKQKGASADGYRVTVSQVVQ